MSSTVDTDSAGILRRFKETSAADVADSLDRLGYHNQGLSTEIRPVSGDKMVGWAYTISGEMSPVRGGAGDQKKLAACEAIGSGDVAVWSGQGQGVCYFGDMFALGMLERGSAGSLVDGGVRDVQLMREMGYSVYAKYTTPVQSTGRWRVTGTGEAVYLPGSTTSRVVVEPGDLIVADLDEALVVPSKLTTEVLELAEQLPSEDVAIRDALRSGRGLADVRQEFGHL